MSRQLPPEHGRRLVLALAGMVALGSALAQSADPPGRAARLSDAEGSVSLQPAGVTDWIVAPVNRPLTTGDRLWVDGASRAEFDLGDAAVRLGSETAAAILNLSDSTLQLQITAGTVVLHVRGLQAGQVYEIDTPNVAVSLTAPGTYRVAVTPEGDQSLVRVDEGAAQVAGIAQAVPVGAGQQLRCGGPGAGACVDEPPALADALDQWSAARERELAQAAAVGYAAADIPGIADLDASGQWQRSADYGVLWQPTVVAAAWAPYRYGYWAWIAPWGWTWVDDAPWGYAPFHYGRWVVWHGSWCWVPSPRTVRPVYAPALVGWAGGPGVATSAAYGSLVSWFPLGPGEAYVPAYAVSPAYRAAVNRGGPGAASGAASRAGGYANAVGGLTTVPQRVFTSGGRTARSVLRLPAPLLSDATFGTAAPAVVPSRGSVLGPAAAPAPAQPPAALERRSIVARTALPAAPAPFSKVQAQMQDSGGRTPGPAGIETLRPHAVAVPVRMLTAAQPALPPAASPAAVVTDPARAPQTEAARPTSAHASDPVHAAFVPAPSPTPEARQPPRTDRPPGIAVPVPTAPNAAHPPTPHPAESAQPKPSAAEPRQSAPHGDRDSRERGAR